MRSRIRFLHISGRVAHCLTVIAEREICQRTWLRAFIRYNSDARWFTLSCFEVLSFTAIPYIIIHGHSYIFAPPVDRPHQFEISGVLVLVEGCR